MGEKMVNYIPFIGITTPGEAEVQREDLERSFAGRAGVAVKIDFAEGGEPLGLEVWMELPGVDDE